MSKLELLKMQLESAKELISSLSEELNKVRDSESKAALKKTHEETWHKIQHLKVMIKELPESF